MKFYSDLTRYYEYVFPLAPLKVKWLKGFVDVNHITSLLDVGCATGDLCEAMSHYVPKVHGFDLDPVMVQKAMTQYPECAHIFSEGNMLEMSLLFDGESYDLITCFGNTLVHISKVDLEKALIQIKHKLNPGGWFIGQILNYDYVLDTPIKSLPLIDNEAIRFDRTYEWDNPTQLDFKTRLRVKDSGAIYDNVIQLYPIRRDVLEGLLKDTGFNRVTFYKDYNGNKAEGEHLPLIFTAKA